MLHLTYHAALRLTTRTNLTPHDATLALTHGLDLASMPKPIQTYITNRLTTYHNHQCSPIYRLYKDTILVYRPNTYKDTKATRPYALITVLTLPTYLTLAATSDSMSANN